MSDGRAAACGKALTVVASVALLWSTTTGAARAEANCATRILSDVPALEAPEQVKSKRSGTFGPITHIKIAKSTGRMYYCAANSYCYDSNSFQISNCSSRLATGCLTGLGPAAGVWA